jgi:Kdo2-lipid IVA lauroyltransferase/acyltransferase
MARHQHSRAGERIRWKHHVEYGLLRGSLAVLHHLPFGLALWLARRLGDLAFDVVRLRRRVTLDNLRRVFGDERSERDLARVARTCYRNFAMTAVELGLCAHRPPDELEKRVVVDHAECIAAAAADGRGIVYLTAHFGNWELLGARIGRIDRRLHAVAGDQKNLLVDRFLRRLRERLGIGVIPMATAARDTLRVLREGGSVALVADQDAGRSGVFVDFLGYPAACHLAPLRFAYRTGAPVIIGFCRRTGPGALRGELHGPILPDLSRPEDEEALRLLRLYNETLERAVRAEPEQWLWMHRRWKTRPPV